MQTDSEVQSTSPPLRSVSNALRFVGWAGFWIQLGLGGVALVALLFVFSGSNFVAETNAGISISIFWSCCAIIALLISLFQFFRYTRLSRQFRSTNTSLPKKNDTIQVVRWNLIIEILGVTFGLLGAGSAIGTMLSKAVALPQGVAIYDPNRIIRAIDIFAAAASLEAIAAHFVGLVLSLWLFGWLSRH